MVREIHVPKSMYYGPGSLGELGSAIKSLQINHLFVLLSNRAKNKLAITLQEIAKKHAFSITFSTHFSKEPTTDHVTIIRKRFQESGANGILAIGGGSTLDLAKAVAVFSKEKLTSIQTLYENKELKRYPLIAIPTTAGSGSEATKIFVITDVEDHVKHNPSHPSFIPDVAILDPELTVSLPEHVTAQSGMDALAHAIEAYVSTESSIVSDFNSLKAIELISSSLTTAYHNPHDLIARERMLLGSYFAGIAFSNASTNLAHATARPLGAHFHLPHGLSVALTLPAVVQFSQPTAQHRYETIMKQLKTNDLFLFLIELNKSLRIYEDAKERINLDTLKQAVPTLIKDALSGNGIKTNRKIPSEKDVTNVYQHIMNMLMGEL